MQPSLLLDHELAVSQSGYVVRALLKLEGKAPDAGGRVPLNLSLVLDRSGSMAGEKLAAAREAAALAVRRLRPEDVVSVVAYDDEVTTVAPPATGAEQGTLPAQLLAIPAGGMTNLSGGWLRGHELVAEARRAAAADGAGEGGMHRILLLTDGCANVGITDPALLVGLCQKARLAGITTTTIGFGADYDEHLLRAMADAGGGGAYYIERPDQAPGVFEEELAGLLSLAAQNVTVEVRPSAAVQLVAVHHRYPETALPAGVRLDVGDVYAREPKSLLVEFFVPGLDGGAAVAIADVVVQAYVLTAGGGLERQEVRFPIAAPLDRAGRREPEVRREMLLLEAARAREAALAARERGDFDAGRASLASVAPMLLEEADGDAMLLAEAEDLQAMARQFERGSVSAADAKYLGQAVYNAHRKKEAYAARLRRRPGGEG